MVYHVTDDSGFMALVDVKKYTSFVDEDWSLDQLINHFKKEMLCRNLLIWGTGSEGYWKVSVNIGFTKDRGYREIVGSIYVTDDKSLFLINYESLTMGAQFKDVILPEKHMKELLIPVEKGLYNCRIVQLNNPSIGNQYKQEYDFNIELEKIDSNKENPNWNTIPWFIHK